MHLSRSCPFSNKTNLHLELQGLNAVRHRKSAQKAEKRAHKSEEPKSPQKNLKARKRAQKGAEACQKKESKKGAKGLKRAQKSAKERKELQKSAKECKRALPRKTCKQPGLVRSPMQSSTGRPCHNMDQLLSLPHQR